MKIAVSRAPGRTALPVPDESRTNSLPPLFTSSMLGAPSKLISWKSNRIYEDWIGRVAISRDGETAIRVSIEGQHEAWDIRGSEGVLSADARLQDQAGRTLPGTEQALLQLLGEPGQATWFLSSPADRSELKGVPASMTPVLSPDGAALLYYDTNPVFRTDHPSANLWIGDLARQTQLTLPGPVMAAVFSSDGREAFVLIRQIDGASQLNRISVADPRVVEVARDLDTPPFPPGWQTIGEDADHIFLAAAGKNAPDDVRRQVPLAARLTKIYRLEKSTGQMTAVVRSAADLTDPSVANGALHWVRTVIAHSVIALPIDGGTPHRIADCAKIPEWSPEGDRLAYTAGQMRWADFAVNLDCHVVSVDSEARPVSDPAVLVEGSHEDFSAVWSPCRRWIAWHTHRVQDGPAAFYDVAGASDAIYVRAAEDLEAPEMEASEDGWEVFQPRWSKDSRKILYNSWDRNGAPGIYKLYCVDFDPDTGRKTGHHELKIAEGIRSPLWATWSPDGHSIAIEDDLGSWRRAVWVMAADGSSAKKLHEFTAHTYCGVEYTPDGQTLIFGAENERELVSLFSIPSAGGQVRELVRDDHNLLHPSISPDGKWIAATRILVTQELWRAPLRTDSHA